MIYQLWMGEPKKWSLFELLYRMELEVGLSGGMTRSFPSRSIQKPRITLKGVFFVQTGLWDLILTIAVVVEKAGVGIWKSMAEEERESYANRHNF